MEEGAFGLSTGLEYAPGKYTDTEEIIELSSVKWSQSTRAFMPHT